MRSIRKIKYYQINIFKKKFTLVAYIIGQYAMLKSQMLFEELFF